MSERPTLILVGVEEDAPPPKPKAGNAYLRALNSHAEAINGLLTHGASRQREIIDLDTQAREHDRTLIELREAVAALTKRIEELEKRPTWSYTPTPYNPPPVMPAQPWRYDPLPAYPGPFPGQIWCSTDPAATAAAPCVSTDFMQRSQP